MRGILRVVVRLRHFGLPRAGGGENGAATTNGAGIVQYGLPRADGDALRHCAARSWYSGHVYYSNNSFHQNYPIMKQKDQTAPDRPVRMPYTPPYAEVYAIEVERGFASSIEDPDTQEDNNFYD